MAFGAVMQGCGETPLPQDICNWLGDDNNCYARFANDIGSVCGYDFVEGNDPFESSTGFFQDREDLTTCILSAGGQVVLDPPPTFDQFPLTNVGFKVLDFFGVECGSFAMTSEAAYSITISEVNKDDAGTITNPDGTPLEDDITGGTFSTTTPTADQLNVTCPGDSEAHNFNVNLLDKCTEFTNFQPRAVLESSPGVPETAATQSQAGYIRLRVYYPPVDPNADGATSRVVEYFNCSIPPPPPPCLDGVQNGDETDLDCGGSCAAGCADGLKCLADEDCLSGTCDTVEGLKMCVP